MGETTMGLLPATLRRAALDVGVDKERSAGVTPTAYLQDRTGLTIGRI
jgi:hypothetical protein